MRASREAGSPDLAPLVQILSREQAVYVELLEIAGVEQQAIVAGQMPQLKSVIEHKHELLARLAALEDRRVKWLRQYASRRRLDPQALTLAGIIERSSGSDQVVLKRLYRRLARRIEQIKVVNLATRKLLEAIVTSIDSSLRYLLTEDAWSHTYGSHGALHAGPAGARLLVDRHA